MIMKKISISLKNLFEDNIVKLLFNFLLLVVLIHSANFIPIMGYDQIEPFEPQHIEEGEIPNLGPYRDPVPMEFRCYLEEGHKYHIFLVGEQNILSFQYLGFCIIIKCLIAEPINATPGRIDHIQRAAAK